MPFWDTPLPDKITADCRRTELALCRRVTVCLASGLLMTFGLALQASAQSASFRSVDTNRDGVLSYDELVQHFGRDGAERLLRDSDQNGDRKLTVQELRQRKTDDD